MKGDNEAVHERGGRKQGFIQGFIPLTTASSLPGIEPFWGYKLRLGNGEMSKKGGAGFASGAKIPDPQMLLSKQAAMNNIIIIIILFFHWNIANEIFPFLSEGHPASCEWLFLHFPAGLGP